MTAPYFSVVLPVRNGAVHVGLAVQSVLDQTFRDFELVVLDNHSEDGTGHILGEFARQDSRVRVLRSERALPIEQNWDRVRQLCESGEIRGEFLTLLGHDDRFLPDFLATIRALIEAQPAAALYQTHFRIVDAQGALTGLSRPIPARETLEDFYLARCWELRDTFGTGYVFRREDYVAAGGMPQYPRLMFSDDMLWLKLLQRGVKVTAPEVCFEYRRHESNTSSEQSVERFLATLQALDLFVDEIERSFPKLLEGEMQREALGRLVIPILKHTEKGAYRLGFDLALVRPQWQDLARRLEQRGIAAPPLRYRPLKRAWHTPRRWIAAATRALR